MNDIKQQLLLKIGDTSERADRVQEQIQKKKGNHIKRKSERLANYTAIATFIGMIAVACFLLVPNLLLEKPAQPAEEPPTTVVPPLEENVEEPNYLEDFTLILKEYFPANSKSSFVGGYEDSGSTIETTWINEYYVQQIVSNTAVAFENIYRIKDNKLELVYREMLEGISPTNMTFKELESLPTIELILEAPFEVGDQYGYGGTLGEGVIVSLEEEITTTLDTFKDVMVVERTDDTFRSRSYYAPGYGYIKGVFESWDEEKGDYITGVTEEIKEFVYATESEDVRNKATPETFEKTIVSNYKPYKPSFHSPWVPSPNGTLRATIEGRGEQAGEEGIGTLVIENMETKDSLIFKLLEEEPNNQYTPKEVAWIDESHMFIIIGYGYGMVTAGGKLYVLDIEKNEVIPIITELTSKEEVMSVKVNADGTFTYQLHVYDTDAMEGSESHIEEKTLPLPTP